MASTLSEAGNESDGSQRKEQEQRRKGKHDFNPDFTQSVIDATGPKAHRRVRQLTAGLVRHLHDFVRENEVTVEEFMMGIDIINEAGQMSTPARNETLLLLDILGLESLVDEITHKVASRQQSSTTSRPTSTIIPPTTTTTPTNTAASTTLTVSPTSPAILGPFYRSNAPILPPFSSIASPATLSSGTPVLYHGLVLDNTTSLPIPAATLDVWHTAPNGLYEQQDPDQPDMNCRGRFKTGEDGKWGFVGVRPVPYPIPRDGVAGRVLEGLDRGGYRPGHVHFVLTAPNYKPITTQLFDASSDYIENDAVFAVKRDLVVEFKPRKGDPKAKWEMWWEFRMVRDEDGNGDNGEV